MYYQGGRIMAKKPKAKRDDKGRVILSNPPKQTKADAKKMKVEERLLRLEIALGIVSAE